MTNRKIILADETEITVDFCAVSSNILVFATNEVGRYAEIFNKIIENTGHPILYVSPIGETVYDGYTSFRYMTINDGMLSVGMEKS